MKLSNNIGNSIEEVVDRINEAGNDSVPETEIGAYAFAFSKAQLAGQYAAEAAYESGFNDDETLEAHLEFLRESGAQFPHAEAMERGRSVIEFLRSE